MEWWSELKRISHSTSNDSTILWGLGCIGLLATLSLARIGSFLYYLLRKPIGQPPYARVRGPPEIITPPRVIIIGAGPGGIAAAGALNYLGIDNIVLERTGAIASSWRGHYKRLHLHTLSTFSSLPHVPFPSHYPWFVPRQQVADYVTGYASLMQVHVNFHETVVNVKRDLNDRLHPKWIVETKRNDGHVFTYNAEVVIVAPGECSIPVIPTFLDQHLFKGQILHSSTYKTAEDFRGKKVLVVGFGNTGGELTIDLHERGCEVHAIIRSPMNIIQRSGIALAAGLVRHLPVWAQLFCEWIVVRLTYGDVHKYGLTCPVPGGVKNMTYYRLRNFHEAPVVDIGQIDLIRKKIVKVHNYEIERFTPSGVIFKNGVEETFDVVILATGFKSNLDQILEQPVYKAAVDKHGFPLDTNTLAKEAPGLYFVGFGDETGRLLKIRHDALRIASRIKKQIK